MIDVCAVVVTFQPDDYVQARLLHLVQQFSRVIVVDNGSAGHTRASLSRLAEEHVLTIIQNSTNLGVAEALNQGLAEAWRAGYRWAVTFDQDSEPSDTFVSELLTELGKHDTSSVALIGPRILGASVEYESKWLAPSLLSPLAFRRLACSDKPSEVTAVITSGALTNIESWRVLGGFDSGLFIDYVDTEYCLRARRNGYKVLVCCQAELRHNLGQRRHVRVLGRTFAPTFHSAYRHYYIARNRVHVARRHARAVPHWYIADLAKSVYVALLVLFAEDNRYWKFRGAVLGTLDGFRGHRGPCTRKLH